jgi:hypothetical protein
MAVRRIGRASVVLATLALLISVLGAGVKW